MRVGRVLLKSSQPTLKCCRKFRKNAKLLPNVFETRYMPSREFNMRRVAFDFTFNLTFIRLHTNYCTDTYCTACYLANINTSREKRNLNQARGASKRNNINNTIANK